MLKLSLPQPPPPPPNCTTPNDVSFCGIPSNYGIRVKQLYNKTTLIINNYKQQVTTIRLLL